MTKAPTSRSYEVCTLETRYRTVCVPGECRTVEVPDECRRYQVVQRTPAREEWRRVECEDCFGCEVEDCYRRVRIPPTYDVCERCETKEGYAYCVETPPVRQVVAETVPCTTHRCEYVPAEYGICYDRECYTPGHWVWEKRACAEEAPPCPPSCLCAPCPSAQGAHCDPCKGTPIRRATRPTWGRCPPAD
jgi:hypothetical protein